MDSQLDSIENRVKNIETLLLGDKEVMTLDDVAVYTKLSKSYLYKLTSSGGIPCYRPRGKHIYFQKSEIDSWLLRNRNKTSEEIDSEASTYVNTGGGR